MVLRTQVEKGTRGQGGKCWDCEPRPRAGTDTQGWWKQDGVQAAEMPSLSVCMAVKLPQCRVHHMTGVCSPQCVT